MRAPFFYLAESICWALSAKTHNLSISGRGEARRGAAGQGAAGQGVARRGRARPGKAWQGKARLTFTREVMYD